MKYIFSHVKIFIFGGGLNNKFNLLWWGKVFLDSLLVGEKWQSTHFTTHFFYSFGLFGDICLGAHTVLTVRNSGWIRHWIYFCVTCEIIVKRIILNTKFNCTCEILLITFVFGGAELLSI